MKYSLKYSQTQKQKDREVVSKESLSAELVGTGWHMGVCRFGFVCIASYLNLTIQAKRRTLIQLICSGVLSF